jgi:hypothetical protein
MSSRAPPAARNSLSLRDAEPAEVGITLHHGFPECTEALLKRETKAQESGKNGAPIHRLLPVVVQQTAQFIRTTRNGNVLRMRGLAALAHLLISMAAYL